MHRLLYISTARTPIVATELDTLLRVSRRNNAAVGVTGLLVAGDGRRFLQALEGPEAAVRATYERIRADPRHHAIVILADQPIAARSFADWDMGYQPSASIGGDGSVDENVSALISAIADPNVRGYFTGFAQRRAA